MKQNSMSIAEAERILGLTSAYTEEDVKEAYKVKIKENHPDLQPKDEASQKAASKRMVDINEANKVVRKHLKDGRPGTSSAFGGSSLHTPSSAYRYTATPSTSSQDQAQDFWPGFDEQRYSYQPHEADDEETPAPQPVKVGTPFYRGVKKVIEKFPLRIAFIVVAVLLFQWRTGASILNPWELADAGADMSFERTFFYFGLVIVSLLNLLIGTMTNALRHSMLWAWDKVNGYAAKEYSIRHAIFGHLPYRIMLIAASVWWYYDLMWNLDESGALDWPLRCVFFAVAAINFVYPLLTTWLRNLLTGEPFLDIE